MSTVFKIVLRTLTASGIVFLFSFSLQAQEETLRVFSLVHADANDMATLIDRLSEGHIRLATDKRTNSIVMVGTEDQFPIIEALLEELDREVKPKTLKAKTTQKKPVTKKPKSKAPSAAMDHSGRIASLQNELNRLNVKLALAESTTEHQIRMMELELESAKSIAELTDRRLAHVRELMDTGQVRSFEADAIGVERARAQLEFRKKLTELEFIRAHLAPLQRREIEVQMETVKRELQRLLEQQDAAGQTKASPPSKLK